MTQEDDSATLVYGSPAGVLPASSQLPLPVDKSRNNKAGEVNGSSKDKGGFKPKSKYEVGWRRVVRNFTPSWFSVTMGTGVVAVLLNQMPYNGIWLYWLSIVFFCLNTVLFFLALGVSIARYTLYPEIWGVMIMDPNNSLFLGTLPMGFATLVEMWIFVCVPMWGEWAATVAWALWIVDAVVAVAVTVSLFGLLSLERFTAAQILPIAATVVAAGTGSLVAEILPDPQRALGTIIACYVLWGMSMPFAMAVLVTYYQRLAVHKLPSREVIVSCFLPLGPLGFGGSAVMHLGRAGKHVFPATDTIDPMAGQVMYVFGLFTALILWGFGLVWFGIALVSIAQARPFPFNMGWWGFTFPLGVFAASTIQIGIEIPSAFFRVLGQVFAVAVILLWFLVAARTAQGAWSGELFYAPCLASLKKDETENGEPKRDA